jgi:hypothetical protein
MNLNYRPTAYDLYEVTPTEWVLQVEGQRSFTGSLKELGKFAIKRFDFTADDLEFAVETMIKEGHNAMHFGVNTTFIYSYQKDKTNDRKTG